MTLQALIPTVIVPQKETSPIFFLFEAKIIYESATRQESIPFIIKLLLSFGLLTKCCQLKQNALPRVANPLDETNAGISTNQFQVSR